MSISIVYGNVNIQTLRKELEKKDYRGSFSENILSAINTDTLSVGDFIKKIKKALHEKIERDQAAKFFNKEEYSELANKINQYVENKDDSCEGLNNLCTSSVVRKSKKHFIQSLLAINCQLQHDKNVLSETLSNFSSGMNTIGGSHDTTDESTTNKLASNSKSGLKALESLNKIIKKYDKILQTSPSVTPFDNHKISVRRFLKGDGFFHSATTAHRKFGDEVINTIKRYMGEISKFEKEVKKIKGEKPDKEFLERYSGSVKCYIESLTLYMNSSFSVLSAKPLTSKKSQETTLAVREATINRIILDVENCFEYLKAYHDKGDGFNKNIDGFIKAIKDSGDKLLGETEAKVVKEKDQSEQDEKNRAVNNSTMTVDPFINNILTFHGKTALENAAILKEYLSTVLNSMPTGDVNTVGKIENAYQRHFGVARDDKGQSFLAKFFAPRTLVQKLKLAAMVAGAVLGVGLVVVGVLATGGIAILPIVVGGVFSIASLSAAIKGLVDRIKEHSELDKINNECLALIFARKRKALAEQQTMVQKLCLSDRPT